MQVSTDFGASLRVDFTNDGRRGQPFNPNRSHFWNSMSGYSPQFGGSAGYQQAYRDGFLTGYIQGYQNWQSYFIGGVFHR